MLDKLRSQCGESMVEVLFSVIIAMLSIALLATAASVVSSVDVDADKANTKFQSKLFDAESKGTPILNGFSPLEGTITLTKLNSGAANLYISDGIITTAPVVFYGGKDMYSYAYNQPATAAGASDTSALSLDDIKNSQPISNPANYSSTPKISANDSAISNMINDIMLSGQIKETSGQ